MNRTNIVISVIAAAALLAVSSAQTNKPLPNSGQVGRYQLLYGEHEIVAVNGRTTVVKGIYRIDTATGTTSLYYTALADPAKGEPFMNEWTPISESGSTPVLRQAR